MTVNYYVINLDRSPERWAAISQDAKDCGIEPIRVAATDGATIPSGARGDLDEKAFRRMHGKRPMDGEFGCYLSHLEALRMFTESDADYAVILEDDASLPAHLAASIAEIASVDDFDLVKLMHHRMTHLRPLRRLERTKATLGTATFGPTGSSAAYLVNRRAAERLTASLLPMRLPFDIALERGWSLGLRVRSIEPDLVRANPKTRASLIGGRKAYRRNRLPVYRRVTTLAFRTSDFLRRLVYTYAS